MHVDLFLVHVIQDLPNSPPVRQARGDVQSALTIFPKLVQFVNLNGSGPVVSKRTSHNLPEQELPVTFPDAIAINRAIGGLFKLFHVYIPNERYLDDELLPQVLR